MDDSSRQEHQQLVAPNPIYLLLCLIGAVALYIGTNPFGHWVLWDSTVYARALANWQIGRDPYSLSDPLLLFVYPPVFLWAGGLLAHIFPRHSGWVFFIVFYAICSLAIPAILARFYLPQAWLSLLCAYALAALEPWFAGIGAFRTGNITNVFYFTVLLAGAVGIRKNQWRYFYLAVLLIATIKLNFLVMLLLPLLIGKRQWLQTLICAAGAFIAYPVQRMMAPNLYGAFQNTAASQFTRSSGYGVMGIAMHLEKSMHVTGTLIPLSVQLVFMIAVISALFILRERLPRGNAGNLWVALVLLGAILCNPRLLPYDTDIALLAGFVILVSALQTRRILLLAAAIFLPSILVPRWMHHGLSGSYEIGLLLICFSAGCWTLWGQRQLHAVDDQAENVLLAGA